jgi:glycosyltransferase involved in cell wall biosynthesis
MPEFFAHSALYYQPEDSDDLARKIIQVVNATPMQREIWRSAAISRADHFNWANTARLTIQELKMAISASNVQKLQIN